MVPVPGPWYGDMLITCGGGLPINCVVLCHESVLKIFTPN